MTWADPSASRPGTATSSGCARRRAGSRCTRPPTATPGCPSRARWPGPWMTFAAVVGDGWSRSAVADLAGGAGSSFADVPAGGLAGRRIAFPPTSAARSRSRRDRRHGRVGGRGVRDRRRAGRGCLPRFRRGRVFPDSAGLAVRGHPGSLDEHSALVRASLYENMLQGRTLTGPQVGRAAVLRPALVQRMREFLEFYDALILPVAPVRAFDAESSTPTWSPGGNSRTISAGWARSVTSPSPAIRRSACRPGSPSPARPWGAVRRTAPRGARPPWPGQGSNRSRPARRYTHI